MRVFVRGGLAVALAVGIVMGAGIALGDAPGKHDVIELKDGSSLEGQIVETKGGAVTIVLGGGIRTSIPWTQIKKLSQGVPDAPQPAPAPPAAAPPAAAPPPAPPPPAPTPPAPQPATPTSDVVTLKSGERVTGKIIRQAPGQFVQIQTLDGATRVLNWDAVKDVLVAPGSATTGDASGAVVRTTTSAQVSGSGAQMQYSQDCQQSPDSPKCHKSASVTANQGGVSAHLESEDESGRKSADLSAQGAHAEMERNCAEHPGDERCTQKGAVDVGKGGVTASYTQETVTRVKEPPSAAVNFAVDVGGGTVLGLPSGESMAFVQSTFKMKILAGQKFPGPDGGGWNGILIEPSAGMMSVFVSFPDGSGGSSSTSVYGIQLGGTAGYQFMTFGKMNPDTLKQSGFGLMLGGFAGATGVSTPSVQGSDSKIQWNSSYGPALGLSFPSYNAGTANYSAFSITAMVLPTGDNTFLSATLGWIF